MKLLMDQSCDHFGRKTLQRAFDLLCGRIGIADYDRTVHLSFKRLPEYKYGPLTARCNGQMKPAGIVRTSPKSYEMELATERSFFTTLEAMAHELIHVKQYITGELSAAIVGPPWKRRVTERWMGCVTDLRDADYDDHPWEAEAHARMEELAVWVINKLESEDVIRRVK